MTNVSLRRLLLGSVLVATAVAFTAFAVFIDAVQQRSQLADLDEELRRAERGARAVPANGDQGAPPQAQDEEFLAAPIRLLLDETGTVLAFDGPRDLFDAATLRRLADADGHLSLDEPRLRLRAVPTAREHIDITALPLDGFDETVSQFRTALVAGGSVILVVVAGVLWAVTGYLIRPVERMAQAASNIADGQLDIDVGPPSGSSETAGLSVDLNRMLARLRGALGEANESRDRTERFLADMAHEIRTPLTALKGYSDLYASGMLEETTDVDRAMARIGSESERLASLANGMLELARDGAADEPFDVVDVAAVADEVAQDLRAAFPSQTIIVEHHDDSTEIHGARSQIHQAILNLGSNACHYNPAPEPIVVTTDALGDMVSVTVRDHGPGIDSADLDRVFLPFFRSDEARSRTNTSGAGLGLALTRQIAERHGGTATVDQPDGGGSAFVLEIPLAGSDQSIA